MRAAKILLSMAFIPSVLTLGTLTGCGSSPETQPQKEALAEEGKVNVDEIVNADAGMGTVLQQAYGYAIFPSVGKGGLGIEGGGGHGSVYKQGQYYGTSSLSMGGIGLTVGGETYTELLVFKDQAAFDKFTDSGLKLDATASAVAVQAGASAKPNFQNGIAVFTYKTKGLMASATVGGQIFTVKPAVTGTTNAPAFHNTLPVAPATMP